MKHAHGRFLVASLIAASAAFAVPFGQTALAATQNATNQTVMEVASTQDPADFIRALGDEAITELAGKQIDDSNREERFVKLMDKYFEMDQVARFVLGRYWRSLSDQELTEFADLLRKYLALNYANKFKDFDGEKFVVGDSTQNNKDTFVNSQVVRPDGPPVKIVWRLREFDGNLRIIDVSIEGISMGITQRDEFASVIQNNGGKVQALIDILKQKTDTN
ncbi:phospholipid-binding protein MlaC [Thalassospira sp. TSL5-1]|uniref:MlaC/ttg2D family ABC transporter substrate-binding protein n=1 Tax=Thalassospira sp. TSL5-1 TaxID=1544451 RepID=UPI00093EDD13|nr:ABC transporter substrate-binding protein [Thalassospira sp. TSL5-1]OKH88169.1 organic solvent ABC transporter [Thalassospira sp. TSL5-1]